MPYTAKEKAFWAKMTKKYGKEAVKKGKQMDRTLKREGRANQRTMNSSGASKRMG
jgi:hypothetical protein